MKHHPLHTERVTTQRRSQMIDITDRIARLVGQVGVDAGMAIVAVPHTTAAVTINENADPDVQHDLLRKLESLIPQNEPYYQHNENNSDSHLKTSLVGNTQTILIEGGRLVLGTWQGVYLCEFDGPRTRNVVIKVVEF